MGYAINVVHGNHASLPVAPSAVHCLALAFGFMNFAALLQLPYDQKTDIIDIDSILDRLPRTPREVAKQFLSDHGRKGEFQSQYSQVNLKAVAWHRTVVTAGAITKATVSPGFREWFDIVSQRPDGFQAHGWRCIDDRKAVQTHWKEFGTWLVPPIFLRSNVIVSSSDNYLVEGHTRVGLLAGLINKGILHPESTHTIWLGTYEAHPHTNAGPQPRSTNQTSVICKSDLNTPTAHNQKERQANFGGLP